VDGQAEFRSLAYIFSRIKTNDILMSPLYADLQPRAHKSKLVRAGLPAIRILARKGVQRIIILLDHEGRVMCIPKWGAELEAAFAGPCRENGVVDVKVVLKAQMYENWLVSDPRAIKEMPRRFRLSNAHERQISPNRADTVDAVRILKSSALETEYHKISDAVKIMNRFDPLVGASNSRSLRRFLRLAGCPIYKGQSKIPA
jgi:hypothetical protein